MRGKLAESLKYLLNLFYPLRCAGCRKDLDAADSLGICSFCISRIRPNPRPFCPLCGRSVGSAVSAPCDECAELAPCFDSACSACLYEGVVRELVHGFKYSGKRSMSGFLSGLMAGPVNDDPGIIKGIGAVTFVPLHRTGMARRGFNQSELLANGFAARFSLPVLGVLEKKRRTKNQNELSRIDRLRNLKGVFSVKKDADDIKGCSLLLIDDVMTTGATLSECARVLKESGAKEVRCLTLARGA